MTAAVNGQQRTEDPLDVVMAGFMAVCALEARLRTRLDANLDAAREALIAAMAEPWVEGSTGQLRAHPGFVVANACDATALALYRELTRHIDEMAPELAKLLNRGRDRG